MNLETQDRKEAVLARMGGMGFSAEELGIAREILEETQNFAKPWKTRFFPSDLFDFLGYAVWCVIGYHLTLDIWSGLFYEEVWKNVLAVVFIPVFAYGTLLVVRHAAFSAVSFVTGFPALSLDEERIRVKWKTFDWNDVFLVHFYKTRPVYNPVTHYASFSVLEDKKTESVNISDLGSGWEKARVAITACALLRHVGVDDAVRQASIIDNIPRRSSK